MSRHNPHRVRPRKSNGLISASPAADATPHPYQRGDPSAHPPAPIFLLLARIQQPASGRLVGVVVLLYRSQGQQRCALRGVHAGQAADVHSLVATIAPKYAQTSATARLPPRHLPPPHRPPPPPPRP